MFIFPQEPSVSDNSTKTGRDQWFLPNSWLMIDPFFLKPCWPVYLTSLGMSLREGNNSQPLYPAFLSYILFNPFFQSDCRPSEVVICMNSVWLSMQQSLFLITLSSHVFLSLLLFIEKRHWLKVRTALDL